MVLVQMATIWVDAEFLLRSSPTRRKLLDEIGVRLVVETGWTKMRIPSSLRLQLPGHTSCIYAPEGAGLVT